MVCVDSLYHFNNKEKSFFPGMHYFLFVQQSLLYSVYDMWHKSCLASFDKIIFADVLLSMLFLRTVISLITHTLKWEYFQMKYETHEVIQSTFESTLKRSITSKTA